MSIEVVGIGQAELHHLAVVDRYPEMDSRVDLAGFSIQGGGTVATALATLRGLDVDTCFMGKLSDDDFGDFILRGLTGLGVDVSHVVRQPGCLSPYSYIIIERNTQRRTVLHTEGNMDPLLPGELDLDCVKQARLLVVDGHLMESQIHAAEEARRHGVTVVLDAGRITEGMGELVALSDVLLASERYASEVAPRGEIEDCLAELHRMGPRIVVVTMGEEGSIGLEGEKLVRQPPLQVEVVDTTGAGDVYLGGYCYSLLKQWPLERCMQFASAIAGLSCRELGSRAGLPDLDEVEAISWQEVHT